MADSDLSSDINAMFMIRHVPSVNDLIRTRSYHIYLLWLIPVFYVVERDEIVRPMTRP